MFPLFQSQGKPPTLYFITKDLATHRSQKFCLSRDCQYVRPYVKHNSWKLREQHHYHRYMFDIGHPCYDMLIYGEANESDRIYGISLLTCWLCCDRYTYLSGTMIILFSVMDVRSAFINSFHILEQPIIFCRPPSNSVLLLFQGARCGFSLTF